MGLLAFTFTTLWIVLLKEDATGFYLLPINFGSWWNHFDATQILGRWDFASEPQAHSLVTSCVTIHTGWSGTAAVPSSSIFGFLLLIFVPPSIRTQVSPHHETRCSLDQAARCDTLRLESEASSDTWVVFFFIPDRLQASVLKWNYWATECTLHALWLLINTVGSRFTTGLRSRIFGCKSNRIVKRILFKWFKLR